MNCRKARSFILASYDNELSHSTRNELLKHVEKCTTCQREMLLLEQMKAGVRAIPKDNLSDDFNNKLFARIYSAPRTEATRVSDAPSAIAYYFKSIAPLFMAVCAVFIIAWVGLNQFLLSSEQNQFAKTSEEIIQDINENPPSVYSDYYNRGYTSNNFSFSASKLDSLQIAASMKDNRLLLNRLRLEAARNFGGFNDNLLRRSEDDLDSAPRRYIYPIIRNANSDRDPY